MSITLTVTYREVLAPETLSLVDKLVDDNYDLGCMLEFIDENSELDFQEYYPLYVELGEKHGFEPVDAWVSHAGADELRHFESAYIGEYLNPRNMAEDYFEDDTSRLDYRIVIDWAETAEYLLDQEVDRVGDFYFRCSF